MGRTDDLERIGYGICILPHFVACGYADLVPILPREMHLDRAYRLVVHEDLAEAPRIRVVCDFLRRQAGATAPGRLLAAGRSVARSSSAGLSASDPLVVSDLQCHFAKSCL